MRLVSFLPEIEPFDFKRGNGYNPDMDIFETEMGFVIEAEVPGISKEDLKLNIEDDILTLEGEKKSENKDEEYLRKESKEGGFSESFSLPENVDKDKIKAKFENGVLRITIPKVKVLKQKEVTIN
jgi:HSP20 family protein